MVICLLKGVFSSMEDHSSHEQAPDCQSAAKNVAKKNRKGAANLPLIGLLCTFLAVLKTDIWLLIALPRMVYLWFRKRKAEKAAREEAMRPDEDGVKAQECELCGILTDTLVPLVTENRGKNRTLHVCGDCYQANISRKPKEKADFSDVGNGEHLLRETAAGRDARIARLEEKKNSGTPLQENLFLEDIEDEKTVRRIVSFWTDYDFGTDYPEIDAVLARLKHQEFVGKLTSADVLRLKEDLKALFRGEDLFTVPEETVPEVTEPEKPVIPESSVQEDTLPQETEERPELPDNLLYCRRCRRLYAGGKCLDCGKTDGRVPEPDDSCFLIDLRELQSNMLEDALRQKNIPFMKDQVSGIGDVFREEPPMRGIFRFYVLYRHFADALAVLDSLPVSSPEEE